MHMIGNQIRVDATLRFDHEYLLLGLQGQMIFFSYVHVSWTQAYHKLCNNETV